jgi:hypothetical protein
LELKLEEKSKLQEEKIIAKIEEKRNVIWKQGEDKGNTGRG